MKLRISCLANDSVGMDKPFWGEHGASYLLETNGARILFDTGTTWDILQHNLKILDLNLGGVSQVILSHGHYDHTGGLLGVLQHTQHPLLLGDPLVFNRKVSRNSKTGQDHEIGVPHSRHQLEELSEVRLSVEPVEVLPGIMVTGRIPRLTDYEHIPPSMLAEIDGTLQPDPLLDDRSIVIDLGDSLVLLCGCCHAGIINTLMYTDDLYHKPFKAVIGGIHLSGAKAERIERTVQELKHRFKPEMLHFNHCTGLQATASLINAFGDRVDPCLSGSQLEYEMETAA